MTETINILTYNDSTETSSFNKGGTLNVTVKLKDQTEHPMNCPMKITLIQPNGKFLYDYQNITSNGVLTKVFKLPEWLDSGNLSIIATDQCMWYQNETNITIG